MVGVHASARLPETGQNIQGPIQRSHHPRRTPPRDSKSLPGNKRQKLSHSPEEVDPALAPITQLKSQGSGSDQSANRWFDNANEHIPQIARATTGFDDEPPFFISNQANYHSNTLAPSEGSRLFGVQSRLDSENEDLRGVIDDLTIENRRLKQILRINQRSSRNTPSTDGQDKLFEVRMHGLTSDKRRELEFLLKNFATSVHTSAPSIPNSTSGASSAGATVHRTGKAKTDSGYASNSNSGQPSHQSRNIQRVTQSANDKNSNAYLRDIPDTLMPRQQPMVISERARMALVVRRLEQLFTGKNAAPGEHAQSLQQQEVSQLAARADAKNSKKRAAEGTREAHILPPDSKVNFDAVVESDAERTKRTGPKASTSDISTSDGVGSNISRPGSPDQRPTRPLDLDIQRAQVAAENIRYIRHLGFSSPRLDLEGSSESWIYLNLLMNMAQLHTINVTPEFVRRSVKKLSTKFELSKDGFKVRWIGGSDGTVFSKEEEKALERVDNSKESDSTMEAGEETGTGNSSKRSKGTNSNSNAVVSNTTSEDKPSTFQTSSGSKQQISTAATSNQLLSMQSKGPQSSSAFDYKPIVYRERQQDLAEESYLQDSSTSSGTTSRDSSGLAHALSRSNLNQQRKSDEGLITFYNNPFFCSDYSGEKMPSNMLPPREAIPGMALGIHPGNNWDGQTSRLAEACYFTPQFGPAPFQHPKDEKLPSLKVIPFSATTKEETQPLEFVVTGLGGVIPDDNFAFDVDVHMSKVSTNTQSEPLGRIPHTGTLVKPNYVYGIGKSHRIQLLPSRLPPPSYVFFTSSSSSGNLIEDDDISEDSEDESSSSADEAITVPTFMQRWSVDNSGAIIDQIDDDDDDQDDSSVDMLAVARAADPVRIAEQERQYMINQSVGRVVAGSLAATVGASHSSAHGSDIDSINADAVSRSDEGDDSDSDMDFDD